MELTLERVEQRVGAQTHLHALDLTLVPRAVTVLLGATQAGKTTLMRLMAGLDTPTAGRIRAEVGMPTLHASRIPDVATAGAVGTGSLGLMLHLHRYGAIGRLLAVGFGPCAIGLQANLVGLRISADAGIFAPDRIEQIAGYGIALNAGGNIQCLLQKM